MAIPIPDDHEIFKNVDLNFLNFDSSKNQISGQIGLKIGWSYFDEPENRILFRKNRLIEQATKTIQLWYDNQMIDPMDPEATSLIETIHQESGIIESEVESSGQHFRLNENLLSFCKKEEQSSRRLNVLTSRFNSHLKFKDEKFVPHEDREIYYSDGDHEDVIEGMNWLKAIDVQRHRGKKYLLEVYDVIKNHCEIINKNIDLNDLLIGDTSPSFRYEFLKRNISNI